ncbi:hypothetical protein ABZX39_35635 [Streptomyces collinus]
MVPALRALLAAGDLAPTLDPPDVAGHLPPDAAGHLAGHLDAPPDPAP